MLPTEDLFVYVYVLVDDAIGSRAVAIAPRPGPAPACTRRRAVGHRAGAASAGAAQRGGVLGRGGPGLGAPVPVPALPKRGEPADPVAVGRLRAAAGHAGGAAARR